MNVERNFSNQFAFGKRISPSPDTFGQKCALIFHSRVRKGEMTLHSRV